MKIEIELADPKFCKGCPCLDESYDYGAGCTLEYWENEDTPTIYDPKALNFTRPQECIDKHGE